MYINIYCFCLSIIKLSCSLRFLFFLHGEKSYNLQIRAVWEYLGDLVVRIPGFHYCGLGSIPGQGTEIPQAMQPKNNTLVFFPFQYVYPFIPFLISLCFEESDDTEDSLSRVFFSTTGSTHYVYFQSMPSTLYTVFQKVTAERACVIWPSLINHHLGHLSKLYLSIKAQFKSLFL